MARGSRRGDWWVDTRIYGTAFQINLGLTASIPLVDQLVLFDYEDTVVLDRVVGHFFFSNSSIEENPENFNSDMFVCHMRVRPARELLSGAGNYAVSGTMVDGDVAEEDFLWERKMYLDPTTPGDTCLNGNAGVDVPWYHTIDCRVSRRVEQGEAIILNFANGDPDYAVNGQRVLQVTPYLRCYLLH